MPRTDHKELHDHPELPEKTGSYSVQGDFYKNAGSVKDQPKTGSFPAEKPLKGRGQRLLDSVIEGTSVQKALKISGTGIAAGLVLSLMFPPLGIALMAVSAIAGVTVAAAKAANDYNNTKIANSYDRKNAGPYIKRAQAEPQQKKNHKDDVKRNPKNYTDDLIGKVKDATTQDGIADDRQSANDSKAEAWDNYNRKAGKSSVQPDEARLARFTQPLNSLNPNIHQNVNVSEPKVQQQKVRRDNENIRMLHNR